MKKAEKKEVPKPKQQAVKTSEVKQMLPVTIDGQSLTASFKDFSTGSKGWNINGKVVIDGLKCQVSGNIVILGSKPTTK